MISLLKKIFASQEYKSLFTNILHLFFFQGTNYILPLITIPYIVRVVGPEKFGILSFAEIINRYFVMITDYGFNITGTQKISIEREDLSARNHIFSTILNVKLLLMLMCGFILYLIIAIWSDEIDQRIFMLYFLIVPGNILLSYWFYLGMEKMHYLNYPNLISRIGYAVAIFLFLREENQFYLVPLFYGGFLIVGGIASLALIWKKFNIKLSLPSITDISTYLRDGWSIFISTFAINLYRRSNIFLLGLVAPPVAVGYYSAGEKIIIAIQSIFNPIIQAFYPFVSRRKSEHPQRGIKDIAFLLKWSGLGTFLLSLLIIFFAEPISSLLLGQEFSQSIHVLRIGSLVICFGVLNYILGIIFMTNFGYKRQFATRVMITGLFNIAICLLLSIYLQEIGAAIAFVFAEFFLLTMLSLFIYRNKKNWSVANNA